MARVTGVDAIFFKAGDLKVLSDWYGSVLGLQTESWGGAKFETGASGPPHLAWSPFAETTDYFAPSTRECMINHAVDDFDGNGAAEGSLKRRATNTYCLTVIFFLRASACKCNRPNRNGAEVASRAVRLFFRNRPQTIFRLTAFGPFLSASISKLTRCPSLSPRSPAA